MKVLRGALPLPSVQQLSHQNAATMRNMKLLAARKCLGDVSKLVAVKAFNVIFLHQRVNILLDIGYLRREASLDLLNDFADELAMLQLLP